VSVALVLLVAHAAGGALCLGAQRAPPAVGRALWRCAPEGHAYEVRRLRTPAVG